MFTILVVKKIKVEGEGWGEGGGQIKPGREAPQIHKTHRIES